MISLFSGIGAFEKALDRKNIPYNLIAFCEFDKYAPLSYSAIHDVDESYNLGDITKVDETKLPKNVDLITYGFPCQDISLAGQMKGMGEGTRSNLFFDALRIIKSVQPRLAIAENVANLTSKRFFKDYNAVISHLDEAGYNCYTFTINAKDYGIPQNRDRVFIINIRKDIDKGVLPLPPKQELKLRLKDMLEDNVDEKYYLSEQQVNQILNWNAQQCPIKNAKSKDDDVLQCITAKSNTSMNASMLLIKETTKVVEVCDFRYDEGIRTRLDTDICPTLAAKSHGISGRPMIKEYITIPEATKQGYKEAYEGDGVYIDRPHQKRGVVQSGMIPTLKTSGKDVGVVVENLRLRYVTPLESFRLMGFDDDDFYKAQKVCSNSQLYKQAGNSIVVNVLEALYETIMPYLKNEPMEQQIKTKTAIQMELPI